MPARLHARHAPPALGTHHQHLLRRRRRGTGRRGRLRCEQVRRGGLSFAVAQEIARFGIKVTVVEPGFFRTDLLNPQSVEWSSGHIADYGPAGNVEAAWATYRGKQPNDPTALGEVLVQIANMEHPPRCSPQGATRSTRSPLWWRPAWRSSAARRSL
jgi:hypothetical protein